MYVKFEVVSLCVVDNNFRFGRLFGVAIAAWCLVELQFVERFDNNVALEWRHYFRLNRLLV